VRLRSVTALSFSFDFLGVYCAMISSPSLLSATSLGGACFDLSPYPFLGTWEPKGNINFTSRCFFPGFRNGAKSSPAREPFYAFFRAGRQSFAVFFSQRFLSKAPPQSPKPVSTPRLTKDFMPRKVLHTDCVASVFLFFSRTSGSKGLL